MPTYYRFYCLNEEGHIVGVEEGHFASDDVARAQARSLLPMRSRCASVEVWNRGRLVSVIRDANGNAPAESKLVD